MVYKFFVKYSAGSGVNWKSAFNNGNLAEELHKPIIRNFKKEHFIQDSKTICGVLICN